MPTRRRTKIVATIGPASDSARMVTGLVEAGMDVARVSLAHGPIEGNLERLAVVRSAAEATGRKIAILADLPGPKIRAAAFPDEGVYFESGAELVLTPAEPGDTSDWERVAVDHAELLTDLREGDRIAIGDGGVSLLVESVGADSARARVLSGGRVGGRPGVNLPPERFSIATPTPDDLRLLDLVCEFGVDAVAVSFVRDHQDVRTVKKAAGASGPMIIAKIETQSAVDDLEAVVAESDGVMVARGDLGIRCALEDVPHYQKRIIQVGVSFGRPVITATQMLESMISAPTPTRAEVSDVATSVSQGTSAVMLSAETAVGHDPVLVVSTMSRILRRAEAEFDYAGWGSRLGRVQSAAGSRLPAAARITAAISAAAWRAAADAEVAAVIACTNSGATARAISRFRPTAPLLGATPSERAARQLSMAWGVRPLLLPEQESTEDIVWVAVEAAVKAGYARSGDLVAVLVGAPMGPEPVSDMLRIIRVD